MTVFRYSALNAEGKKTVGTIEAATRQEATQTLRERGMHITSMKESNPSLMVNIRRVSSGKVEETYLFTSHMRRLLRARLPLLEALDATAGEFGEAPMGQTIARVRAKVAGGSSLAEALSADGGYFDDLYIAMIRAAQASGTLAAAFDNIYKYEGRKRDFRRKLTSAMAYPIVLIGVAVTAVTFLMSYVVPKITKTLISSKIPLPTVTQVLIAVSDFAKTYWYLGVVVLLAAAFSPRIVKRFGKGRQFIDHMKVNTPGVRRFGRSAVVARFARTFSSLLATGLRVADALEVAGKTSGNVLFERAVAQARNRIISGGELAPALQESGLFPGYAVQIVAIGEKTGTLTESFEEIAKSEEEDLETATARFLTFLEPVVIVLMAVVVGFIVASVLLPILQLSTIQ